MEELERRLSKILGCKVDVVEEPVRKERFQKEIDRDRTLAFLHSEFLVIGGQLCERR